MHPPSQAAELSRRQFALALPLLGALPWTAQARPASQVQRASQVLMGTRVDIVTDAADAALAQAALQKSFTEMQRLEALLSRYRADSVVSRISAAAGRQAVPVPPEVMAVLQQAQQVFRTSGGAFDPTVGALDGWHFEPGQHAIPSAAAIQAALRHVDGQGLQLDTRAGTAYLTQPGMALDLGGIAKLPILAAGLRVLQREGVANALLNGGGDVLTAGQLQGRPWRVGLRDPRTPSRLLGVLALEGDAIVASSGDYERGFMQAGRRLHHVLNPRTGWPTTGVPGVALLAQNLQSVNGWGTALMVQGMAAVPAWSKAHPGVEVLAAASDGQLWQSVGMRTKLQSAN